MVNTSRHGLESKQVFDYNHMPLGTVTGAAREGRNETPTELIIDLHPSARDSAQRTPQTVSVPFELVFGIRRDEVTLSRSLPEVLRMYASSDLEHGLERPLKK